MNARKIPWRDPSFWKRLKGWGGFIKWKEQSGARIPLKRVLKQYINWSIGNPIQNRNTRMRNTTAQNMGTNALLLALTWLNGWQDLNVFITNPSESFLSTLVKWSLWPIKLGGKKPFHPPNNLSPSAEKSDSLPIFRFFKGWRQSNPKKDQINQVIWILGFYYCRRRGLSKLWG